MTDETTQALAAVEAGANEAWKIFAKESVRAVALKKSLFTSDDVYDQMRAATQAPTTHEPRALGPVMIRAAHEGWISKTNTLQDSDRKSRHNAPLRVWRSNLFSETV